MRKPPRNDRDRPLTDLSQAAGSNAPMHARFQQFASSSPSCIGCRFRRRMGNEVWCANVDLPAQMRPTGAAMRGCSAYAVGDPNDDGHTGVRKGLARLAARRSVR